MDSPETSAPSRLRSFAKTLAWSLLGGIGLGAGYGAGVWYSPLAPLNVGLLIVATVMLGGWVANRAIACVLTSKMQVVGITVLAGVVAVYAAWVANTLARIPATFPHTFDPRLLVEFAQVQFDHGGIQVENQHDVKMYKGGALVTIWLAEAALLSFGSAGAAWKWYELLVPAMCAKCRTWQAEYYGYWRRGVPADPADFTARLKSGDDGCLRTLPPGTLDDDPHLRVDLSWCQRCQDRALVSLAIVSYSSQQSETWLCRHVELPAALLAELKAGQASASDRFS